MDLVFPIWARVMFFCIGVFLILMPIINILRRKVDLVQVGKDLSVGFSNIPVFIDGLAFCFAISLIYLGAIAFLYLAFFTEKKS